MIDPFFDWERENVIPRLGTNYIHLLVKIGDGLSEQSPPGDYEPYYFRAIQIAAFHDIAQGMVEEVLGEWQKDAPGSALLKKAKALVK
jgi:hypothetical protein